MKKSNYELRIRVKGRAIDEYPHEGRIFVEGRKSSEFDLEFKNHSAQRVLVVPSVDGLSPLDGTSAGPDSKGYIVGPRASLVIPGWTLDDSSVAKFVFSDKDKSYAQHSSGGTTNAGVVGVLVYGEKIIQPQAVVAQPYSVPPIYWPQPTTAPLDPYRSSISNVTSALGGIQTINQISTSSATSASATRGVISKSGLESSDDSFGLGTGWGEKADFKINHTTFNRGDLGAQMVIYYDTRRNLEKRGIEIKVPRYQEELPQAFSNLGCKPPPGWQG